MTVLTKARSNISHRTAVSYFNSESIWELRLKFEVGSRKLVQPRSYHMQELWVNGSAESGVGARCKICGFHGGDYEEWRLLRCSAVCVCRLLVTANVVLSSPILVTPMMEALSSSETSVLTRATRRNIPEDAILPAWDVRHTARKWARKQRNSVVGGHYQAT
jgi:hypothetical protein